jgi:biofilm PGA synthesis lipoprotein PgaB
MKLPDLLRPWLALATALCLAASAGAVHAQRQGPPDPEDGKTFRVLAFHDIRHNVRESFATDPEASAVDEATLAQLFAWLRGNGWHPVSLQQVLLARQGGPALPPRALVLTFDDGYASAYTKVFPLLKQFNYPAVMALVTAWLEVPPGGQVQFGSQMLPRERFLTWPQAAEMARSGLVELASHSHDLHHGITANPQGNQMPAAMTHAWDPERKRYENDAAWLTRVEKDLRDSRALIEKNTGQRVRSVVWPYGAWNSHTMAAAEKAGLPLAFTLEDGPNDISVPLTRMRRSYATYDLDTSGYVQLLRQPADRPATRPVQTAMHVDLDYVYDPDPQQLERNLSLLLDRVRAAGPRSVFLQAFSDPDGDGVADAMYFPNRHMPMRADLFSWAAWQLRTRAGVQVYAWMPVMSFNLPPRHPLHDRMVTSKPATGTAAVTRQRRLSPFDPEVRSMIADIYDDLGRHANFAGVLFHDDAMLAEDEDASPAALKTYAQWGLPADITAIRANPSLRERWAAAKTRWVTDFTLSLAGRLIGWQPLLRTARNIFARPLLEPTSRKWLAQDYDQSLAAYDYTAVMAMPYMEEVQDPQGWLAELARRAAATPLGLERTIFELQARDWRSGKPVPDKELARQVSVLRRLGARHLAYYPDDFLHDQPSLSTVQAAFSVRSVLPGNVAALEPVGPARAETGPGR